MPEGSVGSATVVRKHRVPRWARILRSGPVRIPTLVQNRAGHGEAAPGANSEEDSPGNVADWPYGAVFQPGPSTQYRIS